MFGEEAYVLKVCAPVRLLIAGEGGSGLDTRFK